MMMPMAKYKRWRLREKAIRRVKPLLVGLYNLPKQVPADFEFKYDHQVLKDHEPKRITITTASFSADQRQKLYDAVRRLGFIHFESSDNEEVSFDFMVQTDYKLVCLGREYSYSCSTTEPTRPEWGEEECALSSVINNMATESLKKRTN